MTAQSLPSADTDFSRGVGAAGPLSAIQGLSRIDLALLDIVVLWGVIVATIVAFARTSHIAAWLLAPYLAWVSFATFLTFTLWRLNP